MSDKENTSKALITIKKVLRDKVLVDNLGLEGDKVKDFSARASGQFINKRRKLHQLTLFWGHRNTHENVINTTILASCSAISCNVTVVIRCFINLYMLFKNKILVYYTISNTKPV